MATMQSDEVEAFVAVAPASRAPTSTRGEPACRSRCARPRPGGSAMTAASTLRARMNRAAGPPEDSVAMRVVVAAAVEVAILAVVAQGGVNGIGGDPAAGAGARRLRVLVPAAPPFEHHDEGAAVGRTARGVRGVPAERAGGRIGRPGARPARLVVPLGPGAPRVRRPAPARPVVLDGLQRDPDGGSRRALALVVVRPVPGPVGGPDRRMAVPLQPASGRGRDAEPVSVRRSPPAQGGTGASVRGAVWAGSSVAARDRARVHGDPASARDAWSAPCRSRSGAPPRRSRTSRGVWRTRRCRRSRATASSTSRRTRIRASATSSTCARAVTSRTRWRSACARRRPRSGARRRSTRSTGPIWTISDRDDRCAAAERCRRTP